MSFKEHEQETEKETYALSDAVHDEYEIGDLAAVAVVARLSRDICLHELLLLRRYVVSMSLPLLVLACGWRTRASLVRRC